MGHCFLVNNTCIILIYLAPSSIPHHLLLLPLHWFPNNPMQALQIKNPHRMNGEDFQSFNNSLLRQRYPNLHTCPCIGDGCTGRNIGVYPALVKEEL